ncbi:uncharacterized protein LOC123548084 [Mercenaria mercenaria]|uniref:uncharacterized protein LOC123548084 n=1 Tax=Mercenaria mercenaria TaxID=6596 RepID=UPI00234EA867|nr:uncharacterized protein LOC123548084 [Mercenaria mercenaria]
MDESAIRRRGFEDMELIVEGKKVKTNSALLCYNSSVLATLISNARATREAADENECLSYCTKSEADRLKLEMPNLKFQDVNLMVRCLQSNSFAKEDITGAKALRILPLAEQFRMKRLRNICGNALYDSLATMRRDLGAGCLSCLEVLQYLAAADLYSFDNVRKLCLLELAVHTDAPSRKLILRDKHINEGTKLEIMDKICDNMDKDYDGKLKQIRIDMNQTHSETEQRVDTFIKQLDIWKNDFTQEVNDMVTRKKDVHKQLINEMDLEDIASHMDKALKETKLSLVKEMFVIKKEIQRVYALMETKKTIKKPEAERLSKTLEEFMSNNTQKIDRIADTIENKMSLCYRSKENVQAFNSAKKLEENVCNTFKEWETEMQTLAEDRIKYKEEITCHEKTKAELMKMKMKEHKLNTWLKWATPASEDVRKCHCFRHTVPRK